MPMSMCSWPAMFFMISKTCIAATTKKRPAARARSRALRYPSKSMRLRSALTSGLTRSQSERCLTAKSRCSGVVSWCLCLRSSAPFPSRTATVSSVSATVTGSKSRSTTTLKGDASARS